VTESLAKMVYYANHAQRHAADPKAREDMQDVLASQGGTGGAHRFRTRLRGEHSRLVAVGLRPAPGKFCCYGWNVNSFKYYTASFAM